ncbi:MAG: hypothetical protein A2Y77_11515 [Planctomycetes bacterium RBG_13_62_9]|nr:MAG: hypothetical protein A2Y77_11515 [Planctomycetes bacterium RBG_13_62_9]
MKRCDDVYAKRWWLGLLLPVILSAGCQVFPDKGLSVAANDVISTGFNGPPRVRFGCYPSATLGTFFVGPDLGKHGYYWQPLEKNGIAYTCRAGHVDIIHVRIAADWTAYLASRTFETLMNDEPGFSYKLAVDRSHSTIHFSYPPNWRQMSQAERTAVAGDVAIALGPYLAFTMTTWHEILTWFGFRCIGLPTEFPSAFSWEDSFSNLLGTVVGVRALQDRQHPYNKAVEIAIDEEMQKLGIQPARVARKASESVRGDWYTGSVLFFVDIKNRNFDIGLDDGMITPTLLPGVSACPDAQPLSYPVPTLDVLSKHGFDVTVDIRPREWERGKIFQVLFGDRRDRRIQPANDIPKLMSHVEQAAVEQYHYQVASASPR